MKLAALAGACLVALFAALASLAVMTITAAGGGRGAPRPTSTATGDIPPALLEVYRKASASCPLPWEVLAAVGKLESDHGRSTAAGVHQGSNAAGASGPMQFLPATWALYRVDGDADGLADVYDAVDAIWGAARYLCANGAGHPETLRSALYAYNHADSYVDHVIQIAVTYHGAGHVFPIDSAAIGGDRSLLTTPHHD